MKELILVQNKIRILIKFVFLKKDLVFTISFILAVVSCFIHPPRLEYINFKVLVSLFNLMVAIKAFEELKLLDKFAVAILNKGHNSRTISVILILLCFIGSMFVTNDVALLTFIPITLVFFSSIFLSQLISNVPAAILLSNFTSDWKPLLLGVNIGGLGTIIASLASVISYKLFIQVNRKESKQYLIKFSIYNFSFLAILTCIQYFIFRFLKIF